MARSVNDLEFPAVTICGAGQHMHNVEKALYHNFLDWNSSQPSSDLSLEEKLAAFLEEKYQIKEAGISIMDILNTMVSPSDESSDANSVKNNQSVSCYLAAV